VQNLVFFTGKNKNLTGYRIELVERPGLWFWAMHFKRADFYGWIGPASDLLKLDSDFFQMAGLGYSWLWSSPCVYCRTPKPWYLMSDDPHYKCNICGRLAHDHRQTRTIEKILKNLDITAPEKKVRPNGPKEERKGLFKKRLPYPWVRKMRLAPPFFKAEDKVRILWGVVRQCGDFWWHKLSAPTYRSRRLYTVQQVAFCPGRFMQSPGWQVELAEQPGIWFWADRFIKADFTGWIAPASDLTRINREFYQTEPDYSVLWSLPCWYCKTPQPWHLPENGPDRSCGVCGCWPQDATPLALRSREDTNKLEEILRNIHLIVPGKKVRPIGPAVLPIMMEGELFAEPFIEPLDPQKEYLVADFYHGHEGKVLLHGARGAYSIRFLEAV
jgi:hypothetical protein